MVVGDLEDLEQTVTMGAVMNAGIRLEPGDRLAETHLDRGGGVGPAQGRLTGLSVGIALFRMIGIDAEAETEVKKGWEGVEALVKEDMTVETGMEDSGIESLD